MLLFSILLVGCDGDTPPPAEPPAAPLPDPAPEAAPTVAPADAPADAPTEASFVLPVDVMGRVDGLTFWGWSPDSRYFAFETYYPGSGGADCDQVATLHVVDADTDRYAVPPVHGRYPSVEADECVGPEPREAIALLRPGILARLGISSAGHADPIINTESSADWVVEPASGPWFRLTVSQTGTSKPEDYVANGGFRLELHEVGHAGEPKVVESGERTRESISAYEAAMVFCAPDDAHIAVIMKTTRLDFEGSSHGFMSNGTTRIPAMVVED